MPEIFTRDFSYDLPPERIAQTPIEPRDHSRMMVVRRKGGTAIEHRRFNQLPEYLRAGDALVVNQTRVIPARLTGIRRNGGAAELLLLKRLSKDRWEVLCKPGKKLRESDTITFGEPAISRNGLAPLTAKIVERTNSGGRIVDFSYQGIFEEILDRLGTMPLPPYITEQLVDQSRYQTVYARQDGSAAAPTAGLHFTERLMGEIEAMGVSIIPVLLHVGLGTFRPVKSETLRDHVMHSEYYEVTSETADRLNAIRSSGGRIVCVGTTSVRTLETVADETGIIHPGSGETSIFISPGYQFKAVDALITNFHLPESTLLMLISAYMGRERTLAAYQTAVEMEYRFFSFGDAMLIV